MVDLTNKRSDPDGVTTTEESEIKRCADCGTSKTPLWRSGPAGPKSLCNACGIKSRKRGRVFLGIKNVPEKKTKKSFGGSSNSHSNGSDSNSDGNNNDGKTKTSYGKLRGGNGPTLHQRLIEIGREVMMRRSAAGNRRQVRRRKLCEEEQAAVLLMALSYGSVYA